MKKARTKKIVPPGTQDAKAATNRSRAGAVVVSDLPLWNQAGRIGGGLTPAKISSIIREADGGDIRRLMDLSNECRQRDSHLQAVLSVSEESIAGLDYQIVAPEGSRKKDQKAAQWVEDTLRACAGMHRLIAELSGGVFYSFASEEIVWRKAALGRLVPDRFVPIAPRRFRFRREDGVLVLQDDGAPEIDLQAKYPHKFIFSRPRVTGDVPQREGLCRVLVWMSSMRTWSIGDWLKTGEMSWKPWRIGSYKKGSETEPSASLEDREDLETVMRRLTTDFSAVIPDSTDIRIEWPGGTSQRGSTHAEIVNSLANEMSKAVLGQTETTQSSTSSGYAQAKVHDAVRKDMREARARQIGADLTRDLIAPMIRLNFGESVAIPTFQFATQDPLDLKSFSESMKNLKDAGARIPEVWVHEQVGMPIPEEGDRLLGEGAEDEDEADEGKKPAGDGGDDEEEPAAESEDEPAAKPKPAK